jgi:hypothetical protein
MEALDLLKKDWKKNEDSFEQLSEVAIYKMIHQKSSSIVRWIVIISILEMLLWTGISVFYNTDEYLLKFHSQKIIDYSKYLTVFNYVVVVFFISMFYKNYRAISINTSTKQLMKDILKTRKTVQYYVWYNLVMIVISMIIGFLLVYSVDPRMHELTAKHNGLLFIIVFCVVCTAVIFGLFWLFYKLIYGILLKKLYRNFKELQKIDF